MSINSKSFNNSRQIVFLKSWNEWGEGMYLEPDKIHGYKYLEVINNIINEKNFMKKNDSASVIEDKKMLNENIFYLEKQLQKFKQN